MTGYILSILGIVLAGVVIEIIVPNGSINKYIRSIYAIFVVAVLISPIINIFNNNNKFSFGYEEYQMSESLLNYIYDKKVDELKTTILNELNSSGFNNIDMNINYSVENNELLLNSCTINLKKLVIDGDKKHINKYEFIIGVIKDYTNLTDEVIIFYE